MNRQQRRAAAAKARKSNPIEELNWYDRETATFRSQQGKPNVITQGQHKMGMVHNLMTEVEKVIGMIGAQLPPYDTKATPVDYNDRFGNFDSGFLFAIVPVGPCGNGLVGKEAGRDTAIETVKQFKYQKLNDQWALLSTYITTDIAYEHFEMLFDHFAAATIAYSTRSDILTLSEDVALCRALINQTNPLDIYDLTGIVTE